MLINQITIPCIDYDASVEFYLKLGMTQIVDAPPRYARFESASEKGATLSIHAHDSPIGSGTIVYFDHECAEDLDSRVLALQAIGVVFKSEPTDQSWGWREARLLDPAGNEICLMYAGQARRFPSWRIGGRTN